MKTIILSIRYLEPDWIETRQKIEQSGLPVHYVDRIPKGVGSLSEAINRGVREIEGYENVFIVTNILFEKDIIPALIESMNSYDAVHPSFASDHFHQRPDGSGMLKPAPFIELTAPIIKLDVLKKYPLDESMPYWGMDLDFSYRLWVGGYKVGVHHGVQIDHTYIRNKVQHPVTRQRHWKRKLANNSTRAALQKKYGAEWRDIVFPKTEQQIGKFYKDVKEKIYQKA